MPPPPLDKDGEDALKKLIESVPDGPAAIAASAAAFFATIVAGPYAGAAAGAGAKWAAKPFGEWLAKNNPTKQLLAEAARQQDGLRGTLAKQELSRLVYEAAQTAVSYSDQRSLLEEGFNQMLRGQTLLRVSVEGVHKKLDTLLDRDQVASSTSAADSLLRPCVVGAVIDNDEDFIPRPNECEDLLRAFKQQPVQLLGERRTGKSSLLLWAQRHNPSSWPVVYVSASDLTVNTPTALVRELMNRLSDERQQVRPLIEQHLSAQSTVGACQALKALCPLVLLIDEGDALANDGHRYDREFFEFIRTKSQDDKVLQWVSASRQNLQMTLVGKTGSAFLNGSKVLQVGSLPRSSVINHLVKHQIPTRLHDQALALSGSLALPLQHLTSYLASSERDLDEVAYELRDQLQPTFSAWWSHRTPAEQKLLRCCAEQSETLDSSLTIAERPLAHQLFKLGLLQKAQPNMPKAFAINGTVLKGFILAQR